MDPVHIRAEQPALSKDYLPNISIRSRRKDIKYLFLYLQEENANLYYFNSSELLHLHSSGIDIRDMEDHPPIPQRSQTREDLKDAFLHIFCHKIDKELIQFLQERPLPVFIIGDPPILRRFKKVTRNARFIVGYIPFIHPGGMAIH
ncbi:MAG TPA: hypothetical protein VG605_04205 [Puia sp.]|nr:hypothetical protein [Puia sp.]